MRTAYISSPTSEIFSLADASWNYFSRFVSRYQWALDDPGNSARKTEIASAILNKGKDGCCTFCRPEGYTYKLKPLRDWAFDDAIEHHRKLYYVSFGEEALLYFDIDLHQVWQTPDQGEKAKALIEALLTKLFGQSVFFWSASGRGINGYLKVDLLGVGYEAANAIFERLENCLRRVLAYHGNLCDFEINGRVGFVNDEGEYKWAHYGKLPIHQDWNFKKLEDFKSKPTVNVRRLAFLCEQIESAFSQDVLDRHKEYKESLGQMPRIKLPPDIEKAWRQEYGESWQIKFWQEFHKEITNERDHAANHEGRPLPAHGERREGSAESPRGGMAVDVHGQVRGQRRRVAEPEILSSGSDSDYRGRTPTGILNIKLVDLASEPDSFKRQKEALMRYARYLKRVPTHQEAMAYLHDHNLFSGLWEQNLGRRKTRVRDILKWIANTFDASKCAQGSVNVGKYDQWAADHFPNGLIGRSRGTVDEFGEKLDGQLVRVVSDFISVFLAVCEFALVIDKNLDDSLPHNRAQELWEALYAKGLIAVPFCNRKWAACRDELEKHGIIKVTDREYHHGKAMRWEAGLYFPFLGRWKETKRASLLRPGKLTEKKKRREDRHNTLLQWQSGEMPWKAPLRPPRPPPGMETAMKQRDGGYE